MDKPKPDALQIIFRYVLVAIMLMVLFSCTHYVWYRYHVLTNLVTESRCETMEVELRLDMSQMYHDRELQAEKDKPFALIPFENRPDMTMDNKDGAK